jgi:hypothetical protein
MGKILLSLGRLIGKNGQKTQNKGKKCTAFSPPCWSRASESAPSAPNKPKIFQLSLLSGPAENGPVFYLLSTARCPRK